MYCHLTRYHASSKRKFSIANPPPSSKVHRPFQKSMKASFLTHDWQLDVGCWGRGREEVLVTIWTLFHLGNVHFLWILRYSWVFSMSGFLLHNSGMFPRSGSSDMMLSLIAVKKLFFHGQQSSTYSASRVKHTQLHYDHRNVPVRCPDDWIGSSSLGVLAHM
jgi:hypothetical protein